MVAIRAKEIYSNNEEAYAFYLKTIEIIKDNAIVAFKRACEYFNGNSSRTGITVISEDRFGEITGVSGQQLTDILLYLYENGITEKQGGMIVL